MSTSSRDMRNDRREHIVVVGGGFAGLNFVKSIDKKRFRVTLLDRNNFHSFPPLFYQIASGGLDPGSICFPFRREVSKRSMRGVEYHMTEVNSIDVANKQLDTKLATIKYDKLVIAAGCTNNFFNTPDLIKEVYTIKSAPQAVRCRNAILDRLERGAIASDPAMRRLLLSFVVIGGGPTGVEVAGALGEMKRYIIQREYPDIEPDEVKITLLEGTDRLLRTMSEEASAKSLEYLERLGVKVELNHLMTSYDNHVVTLNDGSAIDAGMVIWTAGVTGVKFDIKGAPDFKLAPGNRFEVDEFNRVKGLDDVFALGDIAYMTSEKWPRGLPQVAQPAIQQSRLLARQLNKGAFTTPFRYRDKGSMATIGRNLAVADLNKTHLSGFIAWLAWMFVHLVSLLGMRNKLTVLINWIWAYFTYGTALRIIIRSTRYPLRSRWTESPEPNT